MRSGISSNGRLCSARLNKAADPRNAARPYRFRIERKTNSCSASEKRELGHLPEQRIQEQSVIAAAQIETGIEAFFPWVIAACQASSGHRLRRIALRRLSFETVASRYLCFAQGVLL